MAFYRQSQQIRERKKMRRNPGGALLLCLFFALGGFPRPGYTWRPASLRILCMGRSRCRIDVARAFSRK